MTQILLVEDSKNLNKALTMRLEHAGYSVTTAEDVGEAYAKALATSPDVAVVDINLPSGSGIELAKQLLDELSVRVILATANRDPDLPARANACGAVALLSKPFEASALLKTVAQAAQQTPEHASES